MSGCEDLHCSKVQYRDHNNAITTEQTAHHAGQPPSSLPCPCTVDTSLLHSAAKYELNKMKQNSIISSRCPRVGSRLVLQDLAEKLYQSTCNDFNKTYAFPTTMISKGLYYAKVMGVG